jgi:hypothetical protein
VEARVRERIDTVDPISIASMTEIADPNRILLRSEIDDPSCAKDMTEQSS